MKTKYHRTFLCGGVVLAVFIKNAIDSIRDRYEL